MPTISMFYGIVISMRFEDHNPPHFHARYQGRTASFTFDGEVLSESNSSLIPAKQKALIKAWALLNEENLLADWEIAQDSENTSELFVIKGL